MQKAFGNFRTNFTGDVSGQPFELLLAAVESATRNSAGAFEFSRCSEMNEEVS